MGRPRSSKTAVAHAFDKASIPIFLLNSKRQFVYANPVFQQWAGMDADTILGESCNYHSKSNRSDAPNLNGFCPPPETFEGVQIRGSVTNPSIETRAALFVPIDDIDHPGSNSVLVVADDKPTADQRSSYQQCAKRHEELAQILHEFARVFDVDRLVGRSMTSYRIRKQIQLAISGNPNVVVAGPTGSGRERIARTIYYASSQESEAGRLVPLPCAVLDAELLQSTIESFIRSCAELEADAPGTLLLLEADRLAADAQAVLVGFLSISELQLQVLATCRKRPLDLADAGSFRRDLAMVMSTLEIQVPPLVDRPEDIELLVQARIEDHNANGKKQISGITPKVMDELLRYGWPGNVDELFEMLDAAFDACDQTLIQVDHLPAKLQIAKQAALAATPKIEHIDLDRFLQSTEAELIRRALHQSGGNKSQAATLLGINRAKLLRRMEQLQIN